MESLTSQTSAVISKCLTTRGICRPGNNKGFARYPPLKDYMVNFHIDGEQLLCTLH